MNKIILIDGNNLAIRHAFANSELSVTTGNAEGDFNPDDLFSSNMVFPTGVLHGFFETIGALREQFPDTYVAVVWDGGYKQRTTLTSEAVKRGIIKEGYKENRRKKEKPKEIEDMQKQKPILDQMLRSTAIPQLFVRDHEADDVIASCIKKHCDTSRIMVVTTDKDFYQLLSDNVALYRTDSVFTKKDFVGIYGIQPEQWIDVGALAGDNSDNIFSPPGWGETTALNAIKQFGTYQKVLDAYRSELEPLRVKYPDITAENASLFEQLRSLVTEKGKPVYPDVWPGMPFSGLALAIAQKVCKTKVHKSKVVALMYEERVRLAYELKKMISSIEIDGLPVCEQHGPEKFLEYCEQYKLRQVADKADIFCSPQVVMA